MDPKKPPQRPKTVRKQKVKKQTTRSLRSRLKTFADKVNLIPFILAVVLAYIVGKMILRYTG